MKSRNLANGAFSRTSVGEFTRFGTRGMSAFGLQVIVNGGTFVVEGSNDGGVTWSPLAFWSASNLGAAAPVASITTTGLYLGSCAGVELIRARLSAFTSGTPTCALVVSDNAPPNIAAYVTLASAAVTATSAVVTAAQGTTTNIVSTAAIIASSIKASAGNLIGYVVSNTSAAVKILKFYNKASAPVAASDTPLVKVLVPAGATLNVLFPESAPMRFSTGIALGVTGAIGNTDTTALAADDINITLITS